MMGKFMAESLDADSTKVVVSLARRLRKLGKRNGFFCGERKFSLA